MESIFDTDLLKEGFSKIFSIFGRDRADRLEQLIELREKAQYLADATGTRPVSWYEFKRITAPKAPSLTRSLLIGVAIGVAGAALITGILALFSVQASFPWILGLNTLIAGGSATYSDYKNQPADDLVKKYSAYLDEFEEMAPGKGAHVIGMMPLLKDGEHVARLRQQYSESLLRLIR